MLIEYAHDHLLLSKFKLQNIYGRSLKIMLKRKWIASSWMMLRVSSIGWRINHQAAIITHPFSSIRLMKHPNEREFVLVDGVHKFRMLLTKWEQEGLERIWVSLNPSGSRRHFHFQLFWFINMLKLNSMGSCQP